MAARGGVVAKSAVLEDDDTLTVPERQFSIPQEKPGEATVLEAEWITMSRVHFVRKLKNPTAMLLTLATYLVISLFIAFVWFQLADEPSTADSRFRVITLQSFFYTTVSNLNGYTAFHLDRLHYLPGAKDPKTRQHFSAVAVWFGKYQSEVPFRFLLSIMSCAIIYPIVGLRPGFNYYLAYQLAFLVQASANTAFAMNVSAIFTDPLLGAWGAFFINFFNYLFNLTSVLPLEMTWILRWLSYVCVSFYVDQMLIANEFGGVVYPGSEVTGDDILNRNGWLVLNYWGALIGAIGLAILFNITGPVLLYFSTRPRPSAKDTIK